MDPFLFCLSRCAEVYPSTEPKHEKEERCESTDRRTLGGKCPHGEEVLILGRLY
jgi:hypothetical protein